ncbi:hypothetical protein FE257_007604 [Aspergillus nanangensis]|uniref:Uncharacterized protein n=1 Tax=Aspergillus nanangensis TaxID=2582783 RepID=A0AAD4CM82_ASPNN|nr:hypothetical protein FE257_007604 [Aspergillus nanangensis]
MATTPPPPSTLRVPPTPRHGAGYDQYEPYTTRHSSRLAGQRASRESNTTPPPSFPRSHTRTSPRKARSQDSDREALSPPGSGHDSPRKKMSDRGRGLFAAHSFDGPAGQDDPFVSAESSGLHRHLQTMRPTMTEGMLPTPAKTPRKKAVGDVGAAARTLFPPAPSSGRTKKTKKYTGFSLDSFNEDQVQGGSAIQIYTDSRDRIPEVDQSKENPFYKKPATRASKHREGQRDQEVNEAIKREDGMFYVFRGKKMFRKFTSSGESDGEDDDDLGLLAARPDLMDSSVATASRPLTRSSIKPRVLFPINDPTTDTLGDVDEEAATDIEDHDHSSPAEAEEIDPVLDIEKPQRPVTPPHNTAVETPESPRSLRPRTKRDGESSLTPTVSTKKKRISPFAGWLRKKTPAATAAAAAAVTGSKRDAEGSPGGPATKRTRGSRAPVSQ